MILLGKIENQFIISYIYHLLLLAQTKYFLLWKKLEEVKWNSLNK